MFESVWAGEYYNSIPRPLFILNSQLLILIVLLLRLLTHLNLNPSLLHNVSVHNTLILIQSSIINSVACGDDTLLISILLADSVHLLKHLTCITLTL